MGEIFIYGLDFRLEWWWLKVWACQYFDSSIIARKGLEIILHSKMQNQIPQHKPCFVQTKNLAKYGKSRIIFLTDQATCANIYLLSFLKKQFRNVQNFSTTSIQQKFVIFLRTNRKLAIFCKTSLPNIFSARSAVAHIWNNFQILWIFSSFQKKWIKYCVKLK